MLDCYFMARLKNSTIQIFCLVFLNTAARARLFPAEIIYMVAKVVGQHDQNQGVMDSALSAPNRKNFLHPMQWGEIWGWGQAKENPQPGVFFPVWKGVVQKSLFLMNFSSSQSVDSDGRISTPRGTAPSHSAWANSFTGERKGIPVKQRFQIAQEKNLCHF